MRRAEAAGVDAIKAVLETGRTGMLFARMDLAMFRAVVAEAQRAALPASVHTGSARDVDDALDAGASSVEHGSFSDAIPDAVFAGWRQRASAYDPTLAVLEGDRDLPPAARTCSAVARAAGGLAEAADRDAQRLKDPKQRRTRRAARVDGAMRIAQEICGARGKRACRW